MLVEFTFGALGEPDQAVCLKLLHFAKGEPERIEAWLRTKVGKRKTIQTWGWFLQVAEAELRDTSRGKPAIPIPLRPPADNLLRFDDSTDFKAVVAQLAEGKGMA